jgi:hypothetical protein
MAMPRYAIVTVVEAARAERAWEAVGGTLLKDRTVQNSVVYVGAPWIVPGDSIDESAEYATDAIELRLNGRSMSLSPAD